MVGFTLTAFEERQNFWSISHLVSKKKSIYMWQKVYNFCSVRYISLAPVQISSYLQTQICIFKTQLICKVSYFQHRNTSKKISFPILLCGVGPLLSSVFWNANVHLSEIFYFNISESQTYSKYYHCQANILILSAWYIPPSASAQTFKHV